VWGITEKAGGGRRRAPRRYGDDAAADGVEDSLASALRLGGHIRPGEAIDAGASSRCRGPWEEDLVVCRAARWFAGRSEALGVLLQTLDAKELGADRPLQLRRSGRAHDDDLRERRKARYLRSSSSSSGVRSSIAKAASLFWRPPSLSPGGNR
jgi:hypothetical protein